MADILIRHLPDDIIRTAKELAARNHHSLQEEVSGMLIQVVRFRSGKWSAEADAIRERLSKKRKLYSDSTKLIREDRDR
jgi:plasmid stability protein